MEEAGAEVEEAEEEEEVRGGEGVAGGEVGKEAIMGGGTLSRRIPHSVARLRAEGHLVATGHR